MTSSFPYKASGNSTPKDNWDRFDGDSTEPEWDIEIDSDECEMPDSMEDN